MSAENPRTHEITRGDRGKDPAQRQLPERSHRGDIEPIRSKEVAGKKERGGLFPGISRLVRILELPRRKQEEIQGRADYGYDAMMRHTLTQAFHQGETVVHGWVRNERGGAIQIVLGGETAIGNEPSDRGETLINFPPGGMAKEIDPGEFDAGLAEFPAWGKIAGVKQLIDRHSTDKMQDTLGEIDLGDYFLRGYDGPFSYFVVARPMDPDEIKRKKQEVERDATAAKRYRNSEEHQKRAESLAAEAQLLNQGQELGYWDLSLYVGAPSDAALQRVAQGISRMAKVSDHVLRPDDEVYDSLSDALAEPTDQTSIATATSFLQRFAALPKREVPGVRLTEYPDFVDVTAEPLNIPEEEEIKLGKVYHYGKPTREDFAVGPDNLVRHSLVVGASGSGKSKAVDEMLEGVAETGINFLLIDPVKTDHRLLSGRLAEKQDLPDHLKELVLVRPGDLNPVGGKEAIPVSLNIMEPEPGFPLKRHIDSVKALFMSAFSLDEPFPQLLAETMEQVYKKMGWDLTLNRSRYSNPPPYPTLEDVVSKGQDAVDEVGYDPEIRDRISGFMKVRLTQMRRGSAASFLEGGYPIDMEKLLSRNTLLELEEIGVAEEKSFIMGVILVRLAEHLYMKKDPEKEGLGFEVCLEEAHNLLSKQAEGSSLAKAVEQLGNFIAEIRDKGVGMMITDQEPTKLHDGVIANTNVKVSLKLDDSKDFSRMGDAMGLTHEEAGYTNKFDMGEAFVKRGGMDRPVHIRFPDPGRKSNRRDLVISPEAIISEVPGWNDHYSVAEVSQAKDFLESPDKDTKTSLNGRRVRAWAEFAVIGQLMGYGIVKPDRAEDEDGEILWDINSIFEGDRAEVDRRTLECAIGMAVRNAVDNRWREVVPHMAREDLISHVSDVMLATLDGVDLTDEVNLDLVPKANRYARAKFELTKSLMGDYPNEVARYESIRAIDRFRDQVRTDSPEGAKLRSQLFVAPYVAEKLEMNAEDVGEKLDYYIDFLTKVPRESEQSTESAEEDMKTMKLLDTYAKVEKIYLFAQRNKFQQRRSFEDVLAYSYGRLDASVGISKEDFMSEMQLIKASKDIARVMSERDDGDLFLMLSRYVIPDIAKKNNCEPTVLTNLLTEYDESDPETQAEMRRSPRQKKHPNSDEWAQMYGRAIPGRNMDEQLKNIIAWEKQHGETDLEVVLFPRERSGVLSVDKFIGENMDDCVEQNKPSKWLEVFEKEIMDAFAMDPGLWNFLMQEYNDVLHSKIEKAQEEKEKQQPPL